MGTLIVDNLKNNTPLEQRIKITRDTSIAHIRPWILKEGTLLDGDFKLTILQGAIELISVQLNYVDINAAFTEDYAHGFIRFDLENLILYVEEGATETEYILRFEMINHTDSPTNALGLCKRWEAKTYRTYGDGVVNNEAPNDFVEPYGLEIFEYKLGR